MQLTKQLRYVRACARIQCIDGGTAGDSCGGGDVLGTLAHHQLELTIANSAQHHHEGANHLQHRWIPFDRDTVRECTSGGQKHAADPQAGSICDTTKKACLGKVKDEHEEPNSNNKYSNNCKRCKHGKKRETNRFQSTDPPSIVGVAIKHNTK